MKKDVLLRISLRNVSYHTYYKQNGLQAIVTMFILTVSSILIRFFFLFLICFLDLFAVQFLLFPRFFPTIN